MKHVRQIHKPHLLLKENVNQKSWRYIFELECCLWIYYHIGGGWFENQVLIQYMVWGVSA